MKKMLKKISKIIVIIMLLLAIDLSLVLNCVQAADSTTEKIYQIDYCEGVLKYRGIERWAAYVVYEENGEEYPAYCINPGVTGVGDIDAYDVNVDGYITDVMLWRIIINGYPYKTLGELGVANKKEAYLATKQAIYCYLDNRNVDEYVGIGESGARTLKALKQIWNDAHNSTETKISNVVDIIPVSTEWKQDNINPDYISKTYRIEAAAPMVSYVVKIGGENLPEGIIVRDIENVSKITFNPKDEFKVLIPTNQLTNDGSFEIKIETQMDTKPVLYGVSSDANLQNYALTTFTYEDATGSYIEGYQKNNSQIKILKREKETKTLLEGVEFQLLNENKEAIYQSLITDNKGEITLESVEPGTYYLREIRTLQGYVLYDEDIKIDINLNEQVNVIVNNSKEKNIEVSKETTNIEVGKTEENIKEKTNETNVEKETNVTNINKENNSTNINEEINKSNISKQQSETNIKSEINKTNINEEINRINIYEKTNKTNIQKLPKTGM